MEWYKGKLQQGKQWLNANFTFRGIAAFVWFLLTVIPDAFGRKDFWGTHLPVIWRWLAAHSTLSVTITCALLIWLDNRRVIRKREPRPHDVKTLKGRTLRLRADIQSFVEKAPPPAGDKFVGEEQVGYLRRSAHASADRVSKLVHGYELNFAERVSRTYHEYGEAGWSDSELNEVILAPLKNEKHYATIINALGRLAEQSELMEADPNLLWTDVANMTTGDREKLMAQARRKR